MGKARCTQDDLSPDRLAVALGDASAESMHWSVFHHFPVKHLILYVLPFPKSAPAAPEFFLTPPHNFDSDRQRLIALINGLAAAPKANGPAHPLFGPLTNEEWNALQAKHVAHHLKQFGC